MTTKPGVFPAIKEPRVMDPEDWKRILNTTRQQVQQELENHGPVAELPN